MPTKCWGKNVKFTPKNIVKNCVMNKILLYINPNINGNQRATPVKMPKTAPIDNT
jgi:riboflavin biosynthesis pyrimidine reductase